MLTNLEITLLGLEKDQVITLDRDSTGEICSVGLHDTERKNGRENFDFYCFLIWPFVESAWLGAVSLMGLTPPSEEKSNVWVDLAKTQDAAQLLGKTLYHQGDLSYFEAVNKETLRNAFQLFQDEGIVVLRKSRDKKGPSTIKLVESWTPKRDNETRKIVPEGKLWNFIENIAQSRREGKNRRDGATVSSRVLVLADEIGRQLFDNALDLLEPGLAEGTSSKKNWRKEIQTKAML